MTQPQPQRPTPAPPVVDEALHAKEPKRIAGMFDAIARRYDLLNRVLSAGLDRRWRRRAVRALALRPGERVLDLCTGTADVALEAARQAPGSPIVGIDFSHEMLRLGLQKVRGRPASPPIGLVRGDAMSLPVASGSMDAAVISFGIRNVQVPEAACRELARVLRPGGRLAVLEFGLPPPGLVRSAYLWYARRILPAVGRAVSKHASAYAYLPESVSRFPPPEVFGRLLQDSGFPHVEVVPLTFGIVYLYVARR
ncbi:MAG TPA: bifunctional demethylmenaquinone methyltransferase/2-methoxy-6-polyprenyl-1,4-benzoquinol methylase UbiE [Vicinamibacterales bacterium]